MLRSLYLAAILLCGQTAYVCWRENKASVILASVLANISLPQHLVDNKNDPGLQFFPILCFSNLRWEIDVGRVYNAYPREIQIISVKIKGYREHELAFKALNNQHMQFFMHYQHD